MAIYLKIFVFCGALFGIIAGLIVSLFLGVEEGLKLGLDAGLEFGFLMAVSLGVLQYFSTRGIEGGLFLSPHQTKAISLDSSRDDAFEKCRKALSTLGARVVNSSQDEGVVEAQTGPTWKSFGENVQVRLNPSDGSKIEVVVSSSPRFRRTLLDYGKGYQNVSGLIEFLSNPT